MSSREIAVWLILSLPTMGHAQTRLQNDLFAPPKLTIPLVKQSALPASGEVENMQPMHLPRLTSVINAGGASIAVLDGVVLGLNQTSGGYRLLQVGDRNALFMHEGNQVRVHMNGKVEPVLTARQPKNKP